MTNFIENPSMAELQSTISNFPNAKQALWGNYAVQTHVTARSPKSIFFISNQAQPCATISQEESMPHTQVILMTTGHIGADENATGSQKVTIQDSLRLIEALLGYSVQCELDEDFG